MTNYEAYPMEDILELAGELAFKYTSGESTSVTWERAQSLTEAVVYCLKEYAAGRKDADCPGEKTQVLPASFQGVSLREAYRAGLEAVLWKVGESKRLYHTLIEEFEDYGCVNYRDTIIKGFPSFFLRYDPKFEPQNKVLTLDYPSMRPLGEREGVDAVLKYLQNIRLEQLFLNAFAPEAVRALLQSSMPEFEELFLDNICLEVLSAAVLCMAADKPAGRLLIGREDAQPVREFFGWTDAQEITGACREDFVRRTGLLTEQLIVHVFKGDRAVPGLREYFLSAAEDCAAQIRLRLIRVEQDA